MKKKKKKTKKRVMMKAWKGWCVVCKGSGLPYLTQVFDLKAQADVMEMILDGAQGIQDARIVRVEVRETRSKR